MFEPGCYGDGALGHQYTRHRCAGVIEEVISLIAGPGALGGESFVEALQADASDDLQEEYDACDWLNELAGRAGYYWGWRDGDFGLWPDESED